VGAASACVSGSRADALSGRLGQAAFVAALGETTMSGRRRKAVRSSTGFGSGKMGGKPHAVHIGILKAGKKRRRAEQEAGSLPMKECPACKAKARGKESHKVHTCGLYGQKNKNQALQRAHAKGSVAGHSYFNPAKKQAARQASPHSLVLIRVLFPWMGMGGMLPVLIRAASVRNVAWGGRSITSSDTDIFYAADGDGPSDTSQTCVQAAKQDSSLETPGWNAA